MQLNKLLTSLIKSIADAKELVSNFEIIIIDDHSEIFEINHIDESIVILKNSQNKGASYSRNLGIMKAKYDFLVLLDADVHLHQSSIIELCKTMLSDSKIKCLNGAIDPVPANKKDGFTPYYRSFLGYREKGLNPNESCSILETRFCMLHKSVFKDVGYFDTSFSGATVEDMEFSHRLIKIHRIQLALNARFTHEFDNFEILSKKYFQRVRMWIPLFLQRKKFENYGSLQSSTALLLVFQVLSLFLIPISLKVSLLCFFLYLLLNIKNLICAFNLFGIAFSIKFVIFHYLLGLYAFLGGVCGIFDIFQSMINKRRKKLLH